MKPLSEIKINLDLNPVKMDSSVRYMKKQHIDFDVYLPSIGKNLQRGYVWIIEQKRLLIWSMLEGRHIPYLAIINSIYNDCDDLYLVIDGKQRLSTIFDFMDDKFTIIIDNKEYLFSELPQDYQREITHYNIHYYVVDESYSRRITDKQKLSWFKYLNFAGTPQDMEHLKSLESSTNPEQ